MPHFDSAGVDIAYDDEGEGFPVLLIHGFASNGRVNWADTGWVRALVDAGYRAITVDNRGHGNSAKLYDPEAYRPALMAEDAARLIDHLGLERVAVIGYSMGARIAAYLAAEHPDKVAAAVFGGLGANMTAGMRDSAEIIAGLKADALSAVTHRTARQFRIFAEHTGSDLAALATCMERSREPLSEEQIRRIAAPVLVVVGSEDDVGGPAAPLAALLPRGEAVTIERRDHMRTTGDPKFKAAALAFLERVVPHITAR